MESDRVGGVYRRPRAKAASRKALQRLSRLIEQEWPELPYTMMRITAAAARSQDGTRFYWRDHRVQGGDIELNLIGNHSDDGLFTYTAIYSREDYSLNGLRRDFLVPLHPSLVHHQLRWSAPGICDTPNLTSEELAGELVAKLVAFNASEFRDAPSPASPDPTSQCSEESADSLPTEDSFPSP